MLISRLDPRAREILPKGVPSALHGWPSSKPGLFFTLIFRSQYLQKCCKYHLKEMLIMCSCGLVFIVCLLFFYSRFIIRNLIRWFAAWGRMVHCWAKSHTGPAESQTWPSKPWPLLGPFISRIAPAPKGRRTGCGYLRSLWATEVQPYCKQFNRKKCTLSVWTSVSSLLFLLVCLFLVHGFLIAWIHFTLMEQVSA